MPMRIIDYRRLSCAPQEHETLRRALSQFSIVASIAFGVALCGCTTDQAKNSPPAVAAVADTKPRVAVILPKQRPKPPAPDTHEHEADTHDHDAPPPVKVVSVNPNALVGLDPTAVEKMLGAPTNTFKSDPALVWTYVGAGCSFQIIFYPDIKTTIFHALKFLGSDSSGGHLDNSHVCIRNILTARNYGPA